MADQSADRALSGIVVADFTRVLAGPYCTMLLADLGAEVIKVERPPGGDDTRSWGPPFDPAGRSTYFRSVNRNKSSVALDLATPAGAQAAQEIASRADVVVENFAPGTMERFGCGYHDLAADNPGLIYCSITGFGDGAGSQLPGYDPVVQAVGGLMSITGPPGEPSKTGVAVVDVIAGLHASTGILAALHHRDVTGRGQRVSVNLLQSLLSALTNQAQAVVEGNTVPSSVGNRHPSIAPFETFPTADRPIMVCAGNDRQFRSLCEVIGVADLPDDSRFATNADRVANRADLTDLLETALVSRPSADWLADLALATVPAGRVNSIAEAIDLAESLGLTPVVDIEADGERHRAVAHPIRMSRTPPRYDLPPPPDPGPDS